MVALLPTPTGRFIYYASMTIAFTFHGSNIVLLYFSNKMFAKELKIVLSGCCSKICCRAKTKSVSSVTNVSSSLN